MHTYSVIVTFVNRDSPMVLHTSDYKDAQRQRKYWNIRKKSNISHIKVRETALVKNLYKVF